MYYTFAKFLFQLHSILFVSLSVAGTPSLSPRPQLGKVGAHIAAKQVLLNTTRPPGNASDYNETPVQTRCLLSSVVCLIIIVVDFLHMCECSVGVDVGDGTTVDNSILSNVVMGCVVL